jgi:hypothetical protein
MSDSLVAIKIPRFFHFQHYSSTFNSPSYSRSLLLKPRTDSLWCYNGSIRLFGELRKELWVSAAARSEPSWLVRSSSCRSRANNTSMRSWLWQRVSMSLLLYYGLIDPSFPFSLPHRIQNLIYSDYAYFAIVLRNY